VTSSLGDAESFFLQENPLSPNSILKETGLNYTLFLRKTHILGFVYVIFLRLRYVLVIRISLKQILSSFQGGKQIKKIKCGGHRSKITTITSFEKLILATFSKNLRYTCFLETGNSSARKTEIIFTTLDDNIDTSLTQKIFRWFCSNFFFYPSRVVQELDNKKP